MAARWAEGYQLKSLESASFSNGTLTLNFKDTTAIEAGKPYIIKWNPVQSVNEINPVFTGVTITTARPGSAKFELGDSSMGLEFKGVFNRLDIEGLTPGSRHPFREPTAKRSRSPLEPSR